MLRRLPMAVALCALVLTGCSSNSASKDPGSDANLKAGGEVRVATVQGWIGLNPHTPDQGSSIGIALGNLIYPSAFVVEPDLTPKLNQDLLVSAELTSSEPQQVVYKINPDAAWSDGTPITADDFSYLWSHMNGSNPQVQVAATLGYDRVASVHGSDGGKTVTVDFSKPFGEWQSLFSALLPAHFMKTLGPDVKAWNTGLVLPAAPPSGNAFAIDGKPDESVITFKKNPDWYGAAPRLDNLTVRVVPDTQAVLQAMSNKEVDVAIGLEASVATTGQAKAVANVSTRQLSTPTIQYFAFQFGHPVTGEPDVRRAVATSLDGPAMTKTIFGSDSADLISQSHVFPRDSAFYTVPDDAIEGGHADDAAAILEGAGFTKGSDGYYAKGGKTLVLEHAVSASDTVDQQVAQLAQAQLKEAGIKLKVNASPGATYFTDVLIPGDYDTLSFPYPGSAFPAGFTAALFTCDGGYNFQRYCNPGVDKLYDQAVATADPTARADLPEQIDVLLWKDLEPVPLFVSPDVSVVSDGVGGYQPHPMFEWSFLTAGSWGLRAP